jgi:hypothetical protein
MTPLERVTERVMRQGNPESRSVPTPLLTLEEFFEGNDSVGSIGCNLRSEPEPREFYALLSAIRSRSDVNDVRVQITCVDYPGEEWPFSDTVWIMTTASPEDVKGWFPKRLAPNETWEGWAPRRKYEPCPVAVGNKVIAVWYD